MIKTSSSKLSLHDAELITLHIDRKTDNGQLVFRCEDDSLVTFNMSGFRHVRCDMFGIQNVVSRLFISSQGNMSKEDCFDYLVWLYEGMVTLTKAEKEEIWRRCEEGAVEFLYLEPSLGAKLAILCAEIEVDF